MKRFNKILCVVDQDETMDTAIVQSKRIADDHQADITFISVVKTSKSLRTLFRGKDSESKDLEDILERNRSAIENKISSVAPGLKADILVIPGISFLEIIKQVIKGQYDLVVKCAENIDWLDRMLGSEDMHILRKCPCPVLMLKPDQQTSFRKLLATVDVGDDSSELDDVRVQEDLNNSVLEYGAALSMPELSEMHIGSAWEAYAEDFYRHGAFSRVPEDEVDRYVQQIRDECSNKLDQLVRKMDKILGTAAVKYLQPVAHLVKGKAAREIPAMVEKYEIDLVVMGTVGRVGIPGFIIGNTAESILEQVNCSILAIKPQGFKTPVE